MAPRSKRELKAYLAMLYFEIEREAVSFENLSVAQLRQEIKAVKTVLRNLDREIPPFRRQTTMILFGEPE